jgi:hypothetical protein
MKLLRINDKLITWDLVTDIKILEDSRGIETSHLQIGTRKLRLNNSETKGLIKWMEENNEIETIEPILPTTQPTREGARRQRIPPRP